MPFFASLKRPMRNFADDIRDALGKGEARKMDGSGVDSDAGPRNDVRDRANQGQSKRALLRSLITASRAKLGRRRTPDAATTSSSGSKSGQETTGEASDAVSQVSPRTSYRSALHFNRHKLLPPPQTSGTGDKADGSQPRPVLVLDRIMANLTESEIEKLFSGAPQFFARSQGHGSGAPHPSVAFPLNEELAIRDLTDHTQIEDDAWGCATSTSRLIQRGPFSAPLPTTKARPHFNSRCQERPSMLSMQGLEKGTMGYQAAMELAVSDTLQEEQYGFNSLGSKAPVIIEQRQRLIASKDTLRHLDDAAMMEQLLVVEKRYQSEQVDSRNKSQELYNDLFRKVLHPPAKIIDPKDPSSLAVQIHALVKVLARPNTWIDFSRVEWRIRLGQVLWGFPLDDEVSDGSSINDGNNSQERSEERYWLLLQILLACELLTRLDAITEGEDVVTHRLKQSDIHRFEKEANVSVRWSLILARSWLENITISRTKSEPSSPRWLTTLANKMTLKHEHMHGAYHTDHTQHRHNATPEYIYAIKGRYPERQVAGLLHFAQKLCWPDLDVLTTKLSHHATAFTAGTPINAPVPANDTPRPSYFGGNRNSIEGRKLPIRRPKVEAALHKSGWLSKSYISGLILPGESLSQLLMSTLLEYNNEAITCLGPRANLCGGFVYNGKSYWSTACIVGRVLAAGEGSTECTGWISSDVTPRELGEGWAKIIVEDIRVDVTNIGIKARIWGKATVERESNVLGDADPLDVLPADFILPHEGTYQNRPPSNIRVELKSLDFHAPDDSANATPPTKRVSPISESNKAPGTKSYRASIAFSLSHDATNGDIDVDLSLAHDVYFVTAHPCAASSGVKYLTSPTSPTIQRIDVGGQDFNGKASSPAYIKGHPLHRYYTYTAIHLTELLSQYGSATLEDILKMAVPSHQRQSSISPRTSATSRPQSVLVIDCITGFSPPRSSDMQPLSRMSSLSSSFRLDLANTTPTKSSSPEFEYRPTTARSNASRFEPAEPPSPAVTEARISLAMRRRQYGSDVEMLVRAFCASKGWNAIISRRRRACLACAIREAGALGWRVVVRVD